MAFQDKETNEKWSTLANCTVMEGDFSVSMITSSNFTHENFPVFNRLRVITGHLLIFQVRLVYFVRFWLFWNNIYRKKITV